MRFTIHRFFVLQEELHPGARPFVLSYSVTQVLVTRNHIDTLFSPQSDDKQYRVP